MTSQIVPTDLHVAERRDEEELADGKGRENEIGSMKLVEPGIKSGTCCGGDAPATHVHISYLLAGSASCDS